MGTHRLAQPGTGARRDLVLVYHFVDDKGLIPTSLGPDPCIVHIDKAPWEVHDGLPRIAESVRWAEQRESFRTNRVIASGWSIGCKGLRSQLASGSRPDAIVAADGMHSTWPVNAGHIELWREYAAEHPLLASDCGHRYMRELPAGKRYAAVVDVLRGVTETVIDEVDRGTEDRPARLDVGNVRLWLTDGGLRGPNGPAHIAHATQILPVMLREALRVAEAPADTDPAPPPSTPVPWRDPSLSLGARRVLLAREEMRRENPPSAATVAKYLAVCMRGGKPLGLTRGNHCAAAGSWLSIQCRLDGEELPHGPRAGAKECIADAIERGTWRPIEMVRRGEWTPEPGDAVILDRSTPGRPETAWWGHYEIVTSTRPDGYENIGANEGAGGAWRDHEFRPYSDERIEGFIEFARAVPTPTPKIDDETARRALDQVALTMRQTIAEAPWEE